MSEWKESEEKVMGALDTITKISESLEKISKQVNGQEKLTQENKQEYADAMKLLSEFSEDFKKFDPEKFNELEKKLDIIKKGEEDKSTQDGTDKNKDKKNELKLTQEQKVKADEIFSKLTPEQRIVISSDPERKRMFLEAAIAAEPSVPVSLFAEEEKQEPKVNEFLKLFGITNKDASFQSGEKKGSPGTFFGADDNNKITVKKGDFPRCVGGKVPRPNISDTK